MALLLVRGTQLESRPAKIPLNKKFIFALGLLYLLAIHLPWPVFSLVNRPTNIAMPTNLISWMATSLVLSIGLFQVIRHRYLRYSKLTLGLGLCCSLMTLPLLYSFPMLDEITPRLLGLWGGFFLFVLLQQFIFSSRHKQRIIWFIVLAGWIEALKSYLILFYPPIAELTGEISQVSMATTFYSPQALAALLATTSTASGYLLSRHPGKYGQLSIVTLLYVTPAIMLPLVFIHSPLVAGGASLISGAMIFPYLYRFASKKRLLGWSLSFACGALACLTLYLSAVEQIKNQEWKQYATFRTSLYQAANMLIEKPFTGYGYGKFDEEYVIYSARQHQLNEGYPAALPEHNHPQNEPLFWSVEGGILPLMAMVMAAFMVVARIYSAKPGTRLASFALLIPIALQAQFSAIFYLSGILWLTFVILLFWVDQRVAKYKFHSLLRWQRRTIGLLAAVIPLISILIISAILHDQQTLSQYRLSSQETRLKQLILPSLWQDQLKEFALVQLLEEQNLLDDQLSSEIDVEWLLNKIRLHPRPYYYQLLLELYNKLGDTNRARQTLTEARFLFPTVDFAPTQTGAEVDNGS